jgi:hypothetical protein
VYDTKPSGSTTTATTTPATRRQEPFTKIPRSLVRAVSGEALRVYALYDEFGDSTMPGRPCWASRTYLAKQIGCHPNHISNMTTELKKAGAIRVVPQIGKNAQDHKPNLVYLVTGQPITQACEGGITQACEGVSHERVNKRDVSKETDTKETTPPTPQTPTSRKLTPKAKAGGKVESLNLCEEAKATTKALTEFAFAITPKPNAAPEKVESIIGEVIGNGWDPESVKAGIKVAYLWKNADCLLAAMKQAAPRRDPTNRGGDKEMLALRADLYAKSEADRLGRSQQPALPTTATWVDTTASVGTKSTQALPPANPSGTSATGTAFVDGLTPAEAIRLKNPTLGNKRKRVSK